MDLLAYFMLGFLSLVWISSAYAGGEMVAIAGDICQVGVAGIIGYMTKAVVSSNQESVKIHHLKTQIRRLSEENKALRQENNE